MGHPPRRGSRVLLRLAVIPEPQCLWDGNQGPLHPAPPSGAGVGALRLALVSIKDKQMGRRTSGQPAPGVGNEVGRHRRKGALPRGEQGRQNGRETPSLPIKKNGRKGPAAPQLSSPLPPSQERSERRRGPNGPQASDRPPPSLPPLSPQSPREAPLRLPPLPQIPARVPRGVAPALTQRQADPRGERPNRRRR